MAATSDRPGSAVPVELLLSRPAKQLCTAVFVSGRDPDVALSESALWFGGVGDVLMSHTEITIDRVDRRVDFSLRLDPATVDELIAAYRAAYPTFTADWEAERERLVALGVVARSARHHGDQGCAILPLEDPRSLPHFTPVTLRTQLPEASEVAWPRGDLAAAVGADTTVDLEVARTACDAAFADEEAHTAAFLALHRGEVIAERYGAGADRDMPLESWSMGKTVTAMLIGILVGDGLLDLDAPAPVAEWRGPGDPRGSITLRHLMQMSSGLRCSGRQDPRETWERGVPDHLYPYHEAIDVCDFMVSRPLEHPPGTVGRYRNSDPLTLAAIVRRTVEAQGAEYLSWPQRVLFDRIGIRDHVLETDLFGNFVLCGFDLGTARGWAKLGQLYLQDGVWEGKRILPAGWVDFVTTPAPAWEAAAYGGQLWLNRGGAEPELPEDAYWFQGVASQRTLVIPSRDVVVVRLGHMRSRRGLTLDDEGPAEHTMRQATRRILRAVPTA